MAVLTESTYTPASLLEALHGYSPKSDGDRVARAFEFASERHAGQRRLTGEPFISHPLAVAQILAELHSDEASLAAALLHDVVEDCGVRLEELERLFGTEIAHLADGVTKLTRISFETQKEQQATNFRRMFVAMARDLRVITIKLADRLHNMRTIQVFEPEKRQAVALETLKIFCPIAHRLGIWRIKWELEDLCLKVLDATAYRQIESRVSKSRRERQRDLEAIIRILQERFAETGVEADIQGRAKHFYSIYTKMRQQGLDFSEILDLMAIRVLVNNVSDCYAALGIVHDTWPPIPQMLTDYIARPKPNGYQSIHTKVVGPLGEPLEVQIRTRPMHRVCEYGIAAHWLYKEERTRASEFDWKLAWLRELLDLGTDLRDANEFLGALATELFEDEVFVFTPKGDIIELPRDVTPLDFAYRIHTEVGHRCVGAKVNGRMVPLTYKLQSGDICEVLTQKSAVPSLNWLSFVKTAHARSKIRNYFRKITFEENVRRGREMLEKEAQRLGSEAPVALTDAHLQRAAAAQNYPDVDRLLAAIGMRDISAEAVVQRLRAQEQHERLADLKSIDLITRRSKRRAGEPEIVAAGLTGLEFRLSRCCDPVPGDPIAGYVTRGRGLAIHRTGCHNLQTLARRNSSRIVSADWVIDRGATYHASLEIEALDRVGLLNDITGIVREMGVNIHRADVKMKDTHTCRMLLTFAINHADELGRLADHLSRLSDITAVRRVPR